ncbi:integrase core domain-containing protein [Streptomyces olivaceiscleroticus]|uniref:integrase core domain-containing protein n=1 Tax=Streptomyces olivaceiscleroticus TaxID=68245 RepID=UPI003D155E83
MLQVRRLRLHRRSQDPKSTRQALHTKPCTPRRNGKVERHPRIMAEGLLHARTYNCEDERIAALDVWNIRYNWHRPHSVAGGRPAAIRLTTGVATSGPHRPSGGRRSNPCR